MIPACGSKRSKHWIQAKVLKFSICLDRSLQLANITQLKRVLCSSKCLLC